MTDSLSNFHWHQNSNDSNSSSGLFDINNGRRTECGPSLKSGPQELVRDDNREQLRLRTMIEQREQQLQMNQQYIKNQYDSNTSSLFRHEVPVLPDSSGNNSATPAKPNVPPLSPLRIPLKRMSLTHRITEQKETPLQSQSQFQFQHYQAQQLMNDYSSLQPQPPLPSPIMPDFNAHFREAEENKSQNISQHQNHQPSSSISSLNTQQQSPSSSSSIYSTASGDINSMYHTSIPTVNRSPSPGHQASFYNNNQNYSPGRASSVSSRSGLGGVTKPSYSPSPHRTSSSRYAESRSNSFHSKSLSGSSFDFSIEATVTLPVQHEGVSQQGGQSSPHQGQGTANRSAPNHGRSKSYSEGGLLSRAATTGSQQNLMYQHHQRYYSSSSTSYMEAIPQGLQLSPSKRDIQQQQLEGLRRPSMGLPYRVPSNAFLVGRTSSQISRTSKTSRTSSELQHSNVSGSSYVQDLRRRSAATWCDIPASVWGVPIGIAELANRNGGTTPTTGMTNAATSSPNSGNKKSFSLSRAASQRRMMDIRHSHLTPRLLASEIDDNDEFDGSSVNRANDANSNYEDSDIHTSSPRSNSGVGLNLYSIHGNDSSLGSSSRNESDILPVLQEPTTSGVVGKTEFVKNSSFSSSKPRALDRPRSHSQCSVKSIEEGTRKIRLFVANPDT